MTTLEDLIAELEEAESDLSYAQDEVNSMEHHIQWLQGQIDNYEEEIMAELISKGDYYGIPDTYQLTAGEYNHLLKAEAMSVALMEAGVAEWSGFDKALKIYTDIEAGTYVSDNEEDEIVE